MKTKTKLAALAMALMTAFGAGITIGEADSPTRSQVQQQAQPTQSQTPEPYCPTEDSCTPQYENGRWTAVPVTP